MNINNLNYRPPTSYSELNDKLSESTYYSEHEKDEVMSDEVCTDGRFEIIEKAKQDLLESTNIATSPDEMKVLNNFLMRCWQMGWLDMYERREER